MSTCAKFLQLDYENNFDRIYDVLFVLLEKHYKGKLCTMDEICPLILTGCKKFAIRLFGGKVYGLAVLKCNGFNIPNSWAIAIENQNYCLDALNKSIHYAVRSSANIEDGTQKSFAGMFDSYLDVEYKDLENAIKKVENSIYNERLQAYCQKQNNLMPKMSVIIQEFIEPDIAGVWLGSGENSGMLEWVNGNGEKLVSGKVTPTSENFNAGGELSHKLKINGTLVGEIMIEAQKQLYNTYGYLADIEFCIINDELKFLQYRPVTKIIDNASTISNNLIIDSGNENNLDENKQNLSVIKGVPCSKGKVVGKVHYITEWTKNEFVDGEILLVDYTSPEMVDIMLKSKAIVSFFGGFLCHAGIIAREFDIPCVCGIGAENKALIEGKQVEVDAEIGIIKILD